MYLLLGEIQSDISWRISEISNIKTIPLRYNLLDQHKKTLTLYSVPSLYALWEGFIKNCCQLLTTYLNNLKIESSLAHINVLTHAIENEYHLGNERKHFDKKIKLVESTLKTYNSILVIQQGIPTESNINYKVTNKILERFNINFLNKKYERPLDRLLLFRNKIAHGENSIKVNKKDIEEFSLLIENLMYEILLLIEEYLKSKSYQKNSL
ncbi:hypothetical protein D1815_11945 [Aquimarina sp. AD1]|uniref:MAE_28990/MAE_18760 family HEPN-like nuclease n=1 Tax=Aquimarina sp. (strain AD1) TaxID=1714848 RepID=UPI000E4CAD1B|nr:MAE_28990/MAE_18760 family HEPN-like nuclease [Aquimarina sp. AD1]AXT56438.1 hypothetical protein D1815_11945 [Aquimarina sp. AD1]